MPTAYPSWEALIEDPRIDAVSVATPPSLHHPIVMAAVKRGRHILCEKPFGTNSKQASEMLVAAVEAGVVHMVDFLFRMAPERQHLKELLEARVIGPIRRINVEWTLRGRADRDARWSWQFDPAQGGGVLFALGSHVVDYVEWLFGPVRAVSAHLSTRRTVSDETPGRVPAEDTLDAMLLLHDGTPVASSVSTVTPGGRGHWLSIYGQRGALAVGNSNLDDVVIGTRLYAAGPDGNALREIGTPALPMSDAARADGRVVLFSQMAAAFVEGIRTGRPRHPTFKEGWRAQVLMDAIRHSHEIRTWVDVPA